MVASIEESLTLTKTLIGESRSGKQIFESRQVVRKLGPDLVSVVFVQDQVMVPDISYF